MFFNLRVAAICAFSAQIFMHNSPKTRVLAIDTDELNLAVSALWFLESQQTKIATEAIAEGNPVLAEQRHASAAKARVLANKLADIAYSDCRDPLLGRCYARPALVFRLNVIFLGQNLSFVAYHPRKRIVVGSDNAVNLAKRSKVIGSMNVRYGILPRI